MRISQFANELSRRGGERLNLRQRRALRRLQVANAGDQQDAVLQMLDENEELRDHLAREQPELFSQVMQAREQAGDPAVEGDADGDTEAMKAVDWAAIIGAILAFLEKNPDFITNLIKTIMGLFSR